MKKDFISIQDLGTQEISTIFTLTDELKSNDAKFKMAQIGRAHV